MAKCSLCARDNISFINGFVMTGIPGKICDECHDNLMKLRSSNDKNSRKYFENIIQQSSSSEIVDSIFKELESSEDPAAQELRETEISAVLLSTSDSIWNHEIKSYGGIVTGISVLGTGFISEINNSISDMLGTKSSAFESKVSESKDQALQSLKKEAHRIHCNAVISISINFVPFSGNVIGIVATGTAVTISPM